MAVQNRLDEFALSVAESGVAEMLVERTDEVHHFNSKPVC
jgi:hypothetical protein